MTDKEPDMLPVELNSFALTMAKGRYVEATSERERLYWNTPSNKYHTLPSPITEAIKAYLQHAPAPTLPATIQGDIAKILQEIEKHHVLQNEIKGRDESRSKTLRLVREALTRLMAYGEWYGL